MRSREQRQRGPVPVAAGESPLMEWVEHTAGVEQAHYLLADEPELLDGLFAEQHRVLRDKVELLAASGLYDLIYLIENTSTTLISVEQYRQYCFQHIGDYAAVANAHDARLMLHMCGHLKALLPLLSQLPVCGFEAFTSPTVGNTRLLDGRSACPDKCLIGGTNAALWMRPAQTIIDTIYADLDALPHHRGIVMSSAGVLPQNCPPSTVKAVSDAIRAYPLRC
ncbi:MAG: uroporphyrinogen decarboxylase family protein, partial [Planctomycetota bacterium]